MKKRKTIRRIVSGEQWPLKHTPNAIPKGLEYISHAKKYGTKALRG
jgi:hypothetical protein